MEKKENYARLSGTGLRKEENNSATRTSNLCAEQNFPYDAKMGKIGCGFFMHTLTGMRFCVLAR